MNEFELIRNYFTDISPTDSKQKVSHKATPVFIETSVGDDGSVIKVPSDSRLIQSLDTLVEGVHFPKDGSADKIAYRALAVALSDIAAMGGNPQSFHLALTLSKVNHHWLNDFSHGLKRGADEYGVTLIGGDITRGNTLTLTLMVQGLVENNQKPMLRSGANPSDAIYVTGDLGGAAGALKFINNALDTKNEQTSSTIALIDKYYSPKARVDLGLFLVKFGATAAIDISDGLIADLRHILNASHVGAQLNTSCIPVCQHLYDHYDSSHSLELALTGGDDYELCFCWPAATPLPDNLSANATKIGAITKNQEYIFTGAEALVCKQEGYKHF